MYNCIDALNVNLALVHFLNYGIAWPLAPNVSSVPA